MPTPDTVESTINPRNAPTTCPWKNTIIPGPMAGQLTHKTMPCQNDRCELWWEQAGRCSLAMIAPALLDLHAAVCKRGVSLPKNTRH